MKCKQVYFQNLFFHIIIQRMSYEVTAARRRPQQFDDLVGQEFVAETLKNSIKSKKIAHAYLFAGPRGCGKTSTARILAKALNCQRGPTDTPCGQCANCQEITKGTSLDVIEIDGASNTSVENIRQIKDEVLFPPVNAKYKIYIIDEVHMLSTSAFNALLKTIEEPPPYVIFIFATTELQKVPATIKSRCQQYNFRLVAIDKVKLCLNDAAKELNIQADDEALFWIARESTGSMRDAYTLFDQVVAFSEGHITYEKIRDKLGLLGIDRLNKIFEGCAVGKTDEVLNILDEYLQGGVSIEQIISNSADYLRSLLLIKSGVSKESLLGNSKERFSSIVLGAWNAVQIERALSIYLQLYRDIRYSVSPRYELELSFSRLCWINRYVSNCEVKEAIDAARALLGGVSVPSEDVSKGESSPFLDGGSLPPEQSASQNAVAIQSAEINEKLKIHVEQEQTVPPPSFQNAIVVEPSEIGYTENPDMENDGWTNFDSPPEDHQDFSDFDDYSGQPFATSEVPENHTKEAGFPVQLNDFFTLSNGKRMAVAQLRGNLMAALSISAPFAASNLDKTGEWKVDATSVNITVENNYDLQLIKKYSSEITAELSNICQCQMQFNIALKEMELEEKSEQVEIPVQAKILVDIFKGTIVAGRM